MAVCNDYRCEACDRVEEAWSDAIPQCHGSEMRWKPTSFVHFEWGGPRTYLHIRDEPFASRSELANYAKAKGWSLGESSEKVGGARNDMYEGIGRTYSYPGASARRNPLASLPRRQ